MVEHDPVEESLVAVLQGHEVEIPFKIGMLFAKVLEDFLHLLLLGEHGRRQQPRQLQACPFFASEGCALVQHGIVKQLDADEVLGCEGLSHYELVLSPTQGQCHRSRRLGGGVHAGAVLDGGENFALRRKIRLPTETRALRYQAWAPLNRCEAP